MQIEEVKEFIKTNGLDVKSRKRYLIDKRSYMYKYLEITFGMSKTQIGKIFNKDHATVIHGLKSYEQNKTLKDYLFNVQGLIKEFPIRSEMESIMDAFYSKNTILSHLNEKEFLKLHRYRMDNELRTGEDAIKDLINKITH
jgi:hypothetical protein